MITADPANSPLIDEIVGVDMLIGASPWPTQAPHDLVALPNIARQAAGVVKQRWRKRCRKVAAATETRQFRNFFYRHVGSPESYERRHVPGAVHLPHTQISAARMSQWPEETLFVVYCAGPHCNGADRAALMLAKLGRPVKIMIGGITGWADEGLAFAARADSQALGQAAK